jgi:hypothetical protein
MYVSGMMWGVEAQVGLRYESEKPVLWVGWSEKRLEKKLKSVLTCPRVAP